MLHLLSRCNPTRIFFVPPKRQQQKRDAQRQRQGHSNRYLKNLGIWSAVLVTLALTISLTNTLLANERSPGVPKWSQEDQKVLRNIHTILVTGTVSTWLDVPAPPYNVGITLKLKLEDAGFQVVFDPNQPHDANLLIEYEEYPSGQFQVLEQATAIRYQMRLVHEGLGEIFTHQFDAQPNAVPLGSLYWDTIGNLEEDPFYCFVGDLIRGHIHGGQDEEETLLEVLVRPYNQEDAVNSAGARGATQALVQQRARIKIIQGLGEGSFHTPEAQDVLWMVARKAQPNERGAALTQLGKIGDTTFLSPLTILLEKETDPEVRSAAEHAIQLIESR
ncbi:MAG TPA: HEAT repeat domain-containing protein [Nitrospirales bacterium]|nr:hypothetical protein [Nitrospiraceae bacterium]HNP28032.1 HEAT repeat domain-containing protein [Nitrospirales bacterium]